MVNSDLNLLFGVLALQANFISEENLVTALGEWILNKDRPLGDILHGQGQLTINQRQLLDELVTEHLRQHAGDAQQSLAAMSSPRNVADVLSCVLDSDVRASLGHLARSQVPSHNAETLVPSPTDQSNVDPNHASAGRRFRVLRLHARGGLGQVSLAIDEELHREVALKEIQEHLADDMDSRTRFILEAEITGRLEHPGIVPVYGLGTDANGRPFYAMRFIEGQSLMEAIDAYHLPASDRHCATPERNFQFRQLLRRFTDVCNTMTYAHSRGILHRDLKPSNIMVGKYGETLVVDWGLAKSLGRSTHSESSEVKEKTLYPMSGGSSETLPGLAIGTPAYMSPEQASGLLDELGPPSDVYSLGATLYYLLTGRAPFVDNSLTEILRKVKAGIFPAPRKVMPDIPRALEAICLHAMSLEPARRYASPRWMADDIEHWLADEPIRIHRENVIARGSRWVRKHRAWALSGTAAVFLVAIVSTIAAFWINSQREIIAQKERTATRLGREKSALAIKEQQAAAKAVAEAKRATTNAAVAQEQTKLARRHLYLAHMSLAQTAWEDARVGETLRLLELHRPQPGFEAGPDDLRGFEWYHWDRWCHDALTTIDIPASSLALRGDGQRLAIGNHSGMIWLWDLNAGRVLTTFRDGSRRVSALCYSPNGMLLAVAGPDYGGNPKDQTFTVWNADTSELNRTYRGHTGFVECVAFSRDGLQLASGSEDKSIKIWDPATGIERRTLIGHAEGIESVDFSPDGTLLASGSRDKSIRVWNLSTGEAKHVLKGHSHIVSSVSFSLDGKRLASASYDNSIRMWDVESGRELRILKGHRKYVLSVSFRPDGQRIASASGDRTIRIWNADTGDEIHALRGHTSGVSRVTYSVDGRRLISGADTTRVWNADSPQMSLTLDGHTSWVESVIFNPLGGQLASVSDDSIRLWDLATGRTIRAFLDPGQSINEIAFSPDGQWIAAGNWDHAIRIWEAQTGRLAKTLVGHTAGVVSVAYSPGGRHLVSGSHDQTIRIWDLDRDRSLQTLQGHTAAVTKVTYLRDEQYVASASHDGTVRIWDLRGNQEPRILKGHAEPVECVAVSPDGKWLASGSWDKTARIWDWRAGRELLTLKGHIEMVKNLAFSPDGKRLATVEQGDTIKVWDTQTGQELLSLADPGLFLGASIAFSPDGRLLASAGVDHSVRLWGATPRLLSNAADESTVPFSPQFQNLNRIEYQQAFDAAVLRKMRPSKLEISVVQNEARYRGEFTPVEPPGMYWSSRHGILQAEFDEFHKDLVAKGYQLDVHATAKFGDDTIHAAVWIKTEH